MARFGSPQFAFPEFSGATRRLVLWNLAAYFALLLISGFGSLQLLALVSHLGLEPAVFLSGALWQPITYSFVHPSLGGAFFDLLSLWLLGGFVESLHGRRWFSGLYATSVLGAAAVTVILYLLGGRWSGLRMDAPITGCLGGIFGLLVAIGLLHGEMEFQFLFLVTIKAKYLAIIYALVALAQTFGAQRIFAFAQLGGALAAILYIRYAPRKGLFFTLSEGWYGLRNRYYRWKRRRAARKFQVYMRKQGRTVRFDSRGHILDDDDDHDDRKRWN
jgi:membrane associated rhomboid family serine protease